MADDDRQRWDARYAEVGVSVPPSRALTEPPLVDYLPREGKALDLAGGTGRHAVWLAERGLEVTVADVSPVGLTRARERAAAAGVTLHAVQLDLEHDDLPAGPWDLVLVFHYLEPRVLARVISILAPEGRFVMVHPTRRNLERHAKPSARFLLEEGTLPGLVSGAVVEHFEEGWSLDGFHEATLVARANP